MTDVLNGYLDRYLKENTVLSQTIIVKFAEAAALTNEWVVANYGDTAVDVNSPTTWKYYMNIAGLYHPADEVMQVNSIDTLEIIDFSSDTLAVHTATREAYQFGTRLYYALVAKYPQQELLINGILNPVDIDVAVSSENGTILGYPENLIEANESSLISELESYIKNQFFRWFNAQFAMSDSYYCTTFFTLLHAFLLPKLLNLRLKRCKTNEVHSFHVRMYLASHFGLDQYLTFLTLEQSLWLYRNIRYLERNPGKVKTLRTLIDNMLTARGIPIGEYSVRHLDQFDSSYLPDQIARIKLLNVENNVLATNYHSVEALFVKETELAPSNDLYFKGFEERDIGRFKTSSSAVIQTKMLYSSMVDYTNAVPEPFETVAIREWCHLSMMGFYDVMVSFKDPRTSISYSLMAKDAFAYMQYVLLNSIGIPFDEFPDYLNMQQRRHPKPTLTDILSVTNFKERDLTDVAVAILKNQPNVQPVYSVASFYSYASKIYDQAYSYWFLISNTEDLYDRGQVENMVKRLYEDKRVKFPLSSNSVAAWLTQNNLPEYNMTSAEGELLILEIYQAATGYKVDPSRSLKNIQKALLDLVGELSSYSVQFGHEINAEPVEAIYWPAVRFGNPREFTNLTRYVPSGVETIESFGSITTAAMAGFIKETFIEPPAAVTDHRKEVLIDPSATVIAKNVFGTNAIVPVIKPVTTISWDGANEALEDSMRIPGYTSFDKLSEPFRLKLKSIYQ